MSELDYQSIEKAPYPQSPALGAVAVEQMESPDNSWKTRAYEIEHIVDPNHTLPQITLRTDPEFVERIRGMDEYKDYSQKLAYDETGTEVGGICTRPSENSEGITEIVYVHTSLPGRGYGMAMYLKEIMANVSQGKVLTNDPSGVSESAKRIWEKLHTLGVAVEREPFVPSDLSPSAYRGRYDVM
jgi:hypothetical protein